MQGTRGKAASSFAGAFSARPRTASRSVSIRMLVVPECGSGSFRVRHPRARQRKPFGSSEQRSTFVVRVKPSIFHPQQPRETYKLPVRFGSPRVDVTRGPILS